jgi:hypothetical protein
MERAASKECVWEIVYGVLSRILFTLLPAWVLLAKTPLRVMEDRAKAVTPLRVMEDRAKVVTPLGVAEDRTRVATVPRRVQAPTRAKIAPHALVPEWSRIVRVKVRPIAVKMVHGLAGTMLKMARSSPVPMDLHYLVLRFLHGSGMHLQKE